MQVFLWTMLALVIICLIGVGIYSYVSKNKQNDNDENNGDAADDEQLNFDSDEEETLYVGEGEIPGEVQNNPENPDIDAVEKDAVEDFDKILDAFTTSEDQQDEEENEEDPFEEDIFFSGLSTKNTTAKPSGKLSFDTGATVVDFDGKEYEVFESAENKKFPGKVLLIPKDNANTIAAVEYASVKSVESHESKLIMRNKANNFVECTSQKVTIYDAIQLNAVAVAKAKKNTVSVFTCPQGTEIRTSSDGHMVGRFFAMDGDSIVYKKTVKGKDSYDNIAFSDIDILYFGNGYILERLPEKELILWHNAETGVLKVYSLSGKELAG